MDLRHGLEAFTASFSGSPGYSVSGGAFFSAVSLAAVSSAASLAAAVLAVFSSAAFSGISGLKSDVEGAFVTILQVWSGCWEGQAYCASDEAQESEGVHHEKPDQLQGPV
jgi:hypothetical protein